MEIGEPINELRKKKETNYDGELREILDKILRFVEIPEVSKVLSFCQRLDFTQRDVFHDPRFLENRDLCIL